MLINLLKENKLTIVVASIWLVVATFYFMRTPYDVRSHDFGGHLVYTEYLIKNKKLPHPYESGQTYHPPLYYYIATIFAKDSVYHDLKTHSNCLRVFSIFLGLLSLFIIVDVLKGIGLKPAFVGLVTLFITTIPKYLFVFSTYNNDALAMFSSIAVVYFVYKLTSSWSRVGAVLLLLASTSALYSKYTVVFCIVTMLIFLCKEFFVFKLPSKNEAKALLIIILSCVLFLPYLTLHNYKLTHRLFPTNFDSERSVPNFESLNVKRAFRIPFVQSDPHEWDDPWSHPEWDYAHPAKKSHDYWGFMFVTSLIGEYTFIYPHINFYWLLYFIHFALGLVSILLVLKASPIIKSFALIGLLGYLVEIAFSLQVPDQHPCGIDFRYMAWLWLCWAVMHGNIFLSKIPSFLKSLISRLMLIGIVIQVLLLMTMR